MTIWNVAPWTPDELAILAAHRIDPGLLFEAMVTGLAAISPEQEASLLAAVDAGGFHRAIGGGAGRVFIEWGGVELCDVLIAEVALPDPPGSLFA